MSTKIKGTRTWAYAYADPAKPHCYIREGKVYDVEKIGEVMAKRIIELNGAVILEEEAIPDAEIIPQEEIISQEEITPQEEIIPQEDSTPTLEIDNSEQNLEKATFRKNKAPKRKGK